VGGGSEVLNDLIGSEIYFMQRWKSRDVSDFLLP